MCDKIGVMYLGRLVEEAPTDELFDNPLHPYTRALMSAALPSHPDDEKEEIVLTGEVPSPINPPSGCHLHERCPSVIDECSTVEPSRSFPVDNHATVCHLYKDSLLHPQILGRKKNGLGRNPAGHSLFFSHCIVCFLLKTGYSNVQ